MTKSDLILQSIIQEYLISGKPIGSSELRSRGEITLAASSIRIYFKKLGDLGYVTQLHTSGGRIPTEVALKHFWQTHLCNRCLDISHKKSLSTLCDDYGMFMRVDVQEQSVLEHVYVIEDRFLLLDFGGDEISIAYSQRLAVFLQGFIGLSKDELMKMAGSVGLYSLARKIMVSFQEKMLFQTGYHVLKDNTFFKSEFVDQYFLGHSFSRLENRIHFEEVVPQGYMLVKREGVYEGKNVSLTVIGKINSRFVEFFNEFDTWKENENGRK